MSLHTIKALGTLRLSLVVALFFVTFMSGVGAQSIDTTPSWNGAQYIWSWGAGKPTYSYGQTITPIASQMVLNSFSFYLTDSVTNTSGAQYKAYIYEWNSSTSSVTGNALYTSDVLTAPTGNTFTKVTIDTGGVTLNAGKTYILFLSTANVAQLPGADSYKWGSVNQAVYSGGQFFFNNDTSFTTYWNTLSSDLAFIAVFNPSAAESVVLAGYPSALGAANVIDASIPLSLQFFGVASSATDYANAVVQTLPLLNGSSIFIAESVLGRVNSIVQARQNEITSMASGDRVSRDKNFWVKPFSSWTNQANQSDISGYSAHTNGIVIGRDEAVNSMTRLGVAFAYGRSNADSNSTIAPQSAAIDVYHLLGYGSSRVAPDTTVNYHIGFGRNKTEGHRVINFLSGTANSSYHSSTFTAGVGRKKTVKLNEMERFSSSFNLDYIWVQDSAYRETGSASVAPLLLNVERRSGQEMILSANAKLNRQLSNSTNLILNVGVGYDLIHDKNSMTATYADASDASFITPGLSKTPWRGRFGVGLVHKPKNGPEISARFDREFYSSYGNNSASVKLKWDL